MTKRRKKKRKGCLFAKIAEQAINSLILYQQLYAPGGEWVGETSTVDEDLAGDRVAGGG